MNRFIPKLTIDRLGTRAWWRDVGYRHGFEIVAWHPFLEWLERPWRCKFGRHVWKQEGWYNGDAHAYEERWLECARCKLWGGHTEYMGRPVENSRGAA